VASEAGHAEFLGILASGGHTRYPVVDAAGQLVGLIDTRDVLAHLASHPDQPLKARDVLLTDYTTVVPSLSLLEAAARLDAEPHGILLVVEAGSPGKLIGVLRRQNLVRAYHLASQKVAEDDEAEEERQAH
jgi:CBS domain-containing protein